MNSIAKTIVVPCSFTPLPLCDDLPAHSQFHMAPCSWSCHAAPTWTRKVRGCCILLTAHLCIPVLALSDIPVWFDNLISN